MRYLGAAPGPKIAVAAAIILSLLSANIHAADPASARFAHLSRSEGLSQSFVYTIVQDHEGYLWFGTQEGLNRFDGYEFDVFAHDPNDPHSLSDESIRTMIRDRSDTLWIGTDAGGLTRFDRGTGRFRNYLHDPADPDSISDNRVRVVYEDRSGALWIGTDGSGLERFDRETGRFEHFPHDAARADSLVDPHVWDIIEDMTGTLWIATDAGLSRFDESTRSFTHYVHDPDDPTSITPGRLRVLFEDRRGTLWIGTESSGLLRFDRARNRFERFATDADDPTSLSADRVNAIFEDDAGVLWVGTIDGLNAWDPDTGGFERYHHDPADQYSLAHDSVLSIFQDRGGVIWIGTYDGLNKWNPATRAMLHYRNDAADPGSLSGNAVTAFAEHTDSRIWVGTFGAGLNLLDRSSDRFEMFAHDPNDDASISSDRVMALEVDSEGVLWAGTRGAGLNRHVEGSGIFERFRHDPDDLASLSADGITYILEDSGERLWIATFGGGLNRFDRTTGGFRHLRHDPDDPASLSSDRIMVLFEDSAGALWIGTYGAGLNRHDPQTGTIVHYRAEPDRPDGLNNDEIYMIQEDAAGDLWVGAKGAGLQRWRSEDRAAGNVSFQRFTELDGLPGSTIYSGFFDAAGYLWLSTERGLSRLDTETLEFRNFDQSHGLQGDEFNLAAGLQTADGFLFFGGMQGFNTFDPESLVGDRLPPQIVLTEFLSEGVSISPGQRVTLDHKQNVLSFRYAALDFAAPEKSRYQYRLDGLDQDWVDAGTQRQVTYTNLPAGDYRFRVATVNNDGIRSVVDAAQSFTKQPALWQTWWATLAYLMTAILLVVAIIREYARRTEQATKLQYAEELSVTQARLTEAQRIGGMGNWQWTASTGELWWSDEVFLLIDMQPGACDVSTELFMKHVHPDDLESVEAAIKSAFGREAPFDIDHRIVLPNGTIRTVHDRGEVTFDEHGEPLRMTGTVHDITDRKAAEDNIRHRAEFQALLADLSSALLRAQPDETTAVLGRDLERIGERFDLDTVSILWRSGDNDEFDSLSSWRRGKGDAPYWGGIPWIIGAQLDGEPVVVDGANPLPGDAGEFRKILERKRVTGFLAIPLLVDDTLQGSCVFTRMYRKHAWSGETVTGLRLVAEIIAGAVARSRAVTEIRDLKEQLETENLQLREEIKLASGFDEIIGEDRSLHRCLQAVEKVAPTDMPVLVLGETGTGKELIARAIHKLSPRSDGPMVSVNCPALPPNLIESELFGHEKGAFTGATTKRHGRFELAKGGTLFLDEIGELPLELQGKLLRVLQTGEFERVGGTRTLVADVRLVAATHRDLKAASHRGEFRPDLYFRISTFPISLPPLRNRNGDIALLAEHFVIKHARKLGKNIDAISSRMIRELESYGWPGNVRELEGIIERSLISAADNGVLDLPAPLHSISGFTRPKFELSVDVGTDLSTVERTYIVSILDHTGWKISGPEGAAAVLGMPSSTLRSKMKRFGISRNGDQTAADE